MIFEYFGPCNCPDNTTSLHHSSGQLKDFQGTKNNAHVHIVIAQHLVFLYTFPILIYNCRRVMFDDNPAPHLLY